MYNLWFPHAHSCILYGRADEPMARGKIFLARGIHCCPNFFFVLPDLLLCVEIVYELQLLPNHSASETILQHLSVFPITSNTHFMNNFIKQQLISTLNMGHQHGPDTKI